MAFLPATFEEMTRLGWEAPDFVLVTGDADLLALRELFLVETPREFVQRLQ